MRKTGISWVGKGSLERTIIAGNHVINYQGRTKSLPNTQNFLSQMMIPVYEPFDLRGTVQMSWIFDDERPDSAFAYVPMLRRVRRMSAAVRSDPFLGSDFVTDDTEGYFGKNQDMKWKYLGEKKLLMPFSATDTNIVTENPDGSYHFPKKAHMKMGYDDRAWTGIAYAPLELTWVLRPVWLVEAMAKDPYYNYGKQVLSGLGDGKDQRSYQ